MGKHEHKGRCSVCGRAEMRMSGTGRLHKWCYHYDSWCSLVARNCTYSYGTPKSVRAGRQITRALKGVRK